MRRKLAVLTVAAGLLAAVGAVAVNRPSEASTAAPVAENYGQYTLMFERSAGQYWAGGSAAGQWSWSPLSATVSDISWGDPKAWPPKNAERFVKSGDWVLLDGYNDGAGRPLTQIQRMTSEKIGDAACNNLQDLSSAGGKQHYAQWTIPADGYCIDGTGTIKPPNGSTTVNFRHVQKWLPPHPCSNADFPGQTCITQVEQWWDDNNHPYSLQLDRSIELARGLGMAFTNRTTVPVNWNADGRYYWHY
ncbi:hypothetical protein [Kribbella italica]|uniref:Uncharacterized protein n=1 Tax=Kribbella italica TaxID=1540520 RepID=A0A7W9JAY0_9ACTN|nr:hypothetical protein [Kribbella italica]MBB5838793.1 hypothetical protein [Kribbella italica]